MATITAAATGNWSAPGTWIGGVVPGPGDVARCAAFNVTIDVDITVATLEATAAGRFQVTTGRTVTANVVNSTGTGYALLFSNGVGTTATLIGNASGTATATNAAIMSHTGAGNLTITGTVTGGAGTNIYGFWNQANAAVVINGDVSGGVGSSSTGAHNAGSGSITINGNATGGSSGSAHGVSNISSGSVTVNGNVTGGVGNSAHGAQNSLGGTVTINGNATGGVGSGAIGANNTNNGTVVVSGRAQGAGTLGSYGCANLGAGTMTVGTAVGNNYGPGGSAVSSVVGLLGNNVAGNVTRVYAIESGPYGQIAIGGPVLIVANPATNQAVFRAAYNGATLTLTDPTATADWPDESDVRLGVEYDLGDKAGTCAVPLSTQVAAGIAVDATTGTAVLTQAAAQDAAAAALAAYDPPTQAEMDARTLPAASYATAAGVTAAQAAVLAAIAALEDLSAADVEAAVLAAIEAAVIEGTVTLPEALRICLAFAAGTTAGAGEDSLIYRSQDGSIDRITMTVDAQGERTAVVLDVSP